jgi:hypothetical protein
MFHKTHGFESLDCGSVETCASGADVMARARFRQDVDRGYPASPRNGARDTFGGKVRRTNISRAKRSASVNPSVLVE